MKKEQHAPANQFAAGYTVKKRILEISSIVGFAVLFFTGAENALEYFDVLTTRGVVLCGMFAYLFADFASGLVHWIADTWGSTNVPLLGQTLIRSFREHHFDEKAITRHDFVETNGDNCLVCIPILLALALSQPTTVWGAAFHFVFLNVVFWTFLTNQFHKWAHADSVPKFVSVLHKSKLILSPTHHRQHHTYPFSKSYCITSGWMNRFLNNIQFFRVMESMITRVTGLLPRADDLTHVKKEIA